MQNINIKQIFIEPDLADGNMLRGFADEGAIVGIVEISELEGKISGTAVPIFNLCAIGGADYVSLAKKCGIRALAADADILHKMNVKYFLECGRIEPYEVDENAFIENEIDTEDIGHLESVFALGNGYLGLRGTYDERDNGIDETSGMYINGIFETEPIVHPWHCKGFAENDEYTVNLTGV